MRYITFAIIFMVSITLTGCGPNGGNSYTYIPPSMTSVVVTSDPSIPRLITPGFVTVARYRSPTPARKL